MELYIVTSIQIMYPMGLYPEKWKDIRVVQAPTKGKTHDKNKNESKTN